MVISPLPKKLKEARLAANISQKELGIAAGIDRFSASPRINQYETGKHTPDFLTLKNLAEVLSVPTAFFYAEEDNQYSSPFVSTGNSVNTADSLLSAMIVRS